MNVRCLVATTLLLIPTAAVLNAAEPPSQPNVIVFLVDDMGWMDCGAYGSKYYETPNIDRFAARAMRFTNAYAQPLCSPTRASLLTGKYSARHGITSATGHLAPQPEGHAFLPRSAPATQAMLMPQSKNYLEPSEHTLAEALHDAGYRTAHIGKWHLGLTPPYWPEQQGFDVAFHCHPDPGSPGNYFSPYDVRSDGAPRGRTRVGTITDGPPGEYIVDRLADEAVKFIETNRDRPFFLNLWNYGVHGPWGHKPAYTQAFKSKKDPRGAQGNPIMASMLRSVDECFSRVLDAVDRLGLADNTIIVFNSDNGGNTHSNTGEDAKRKNKKAAILTTCISASIAWADEPARLNVSFLMSDDMRPDLACYGNDVVRSPNIDALASAGVRFDRAYCQYPLCNPSRTSLLTGRHPTTTGVLDNTIYFRDEHPDWITLPQHFKNNGYATLRTGKIFHGGIDDVVSWTEGAEPRPAGGAAAKKVDPKERAKRSDQRVVLDGNGESHGDFRTAERAIEFLQKYKDRPFFWRAVSLSRTVHRRRPRDSTTCTMPRRSNCR